MATQVEILRVNVHSKTPEDIINEIENYIEFVTKRKLPFTCKSILINFNHNAKEILSNCITSNVLNVNGTNYLCTFRENLTNEKEVKIDDGTFIFLFSN